MNYCLLTYLLTCCISQKADMAAAPTLITDARRQVVDFATPFMTTQATLLLRRPPPGTELRVKDLADLVAQSEIKYGTLRKGFIPRNFRSTNDTLLTIVWRNMRRSIIYSDVIRCTHFYQQTVRMFLGPDLQNILRSSYNKIFVMVIVRQC